MLWRFLPGAEKENNILIVRDIDSLFTPRDRSAVDKWLASGKRFHIIRDAPGHDARIMGGLWGCRGALRSDLPQLIDRWRDVSYGSDQRFLRRHIYPKIRHDVLIHSDYVAYSDETAIPFPSPRVGHEWLGMPVFRKQAYEHRRLNHLAMKNPKKRIISPRVNWPIVVRWKKIRWAFHHMLRCIKNGERPRFRAG